MRICLFAAALLAALASPTFGDEVIFRNGDRLSGSIESMEGGKLIIKSAIAGRVTVDMKDVKTFASDGPVSLKLQNGTVLHEKVTTAGDGQVAIAPGGAVQPQNVALSDVKYINFKEDWTGSLTVGGTLARGNTDAENLNIALNLVRRGEKDRITVDAGFLYGREHVPGLDGKHETENDWFISGKYDYFFTPKLYGYANARIERDLIADLSLRLTPGGGVGYQWAEKPDFSFNTEAGISWLYRDYSNDGTDETIAARLAYHLKKKLNDKVALFHNVEYYPGLDRLDNYYFDADAGVRASLTERMFTEFKIEYKYDAAPAPGKGHSDTRFLLGVGWNF